MPDAPRFVKDDLDASQAGWDATVDNNFAKCEQFLDAQPTLIRRVYRVRASNPTYPKYLNLGDFAPDSYEGCTVWIMDPGGAGAPVTNLNTAYSDGTNWRWVSGDATVAGIT